MLRVTTTDDEIRFGSSVTVSFQRTLRIPDDGNAYPLPPGLGYFPILRVDDYRESVPASWREHGGVFIPMYQREALWISFGARWWMPNAVKVGVGNIDAITGDPWDDDLRPEPQNYLVCPDQPWLDGINAGDGFIRQFVAMPLGMGYTVEGQVTGEERFGGIQIVVVEPKPGRFPDRPPFRSRISHGMETYSLCLTPAAEMGLAAGGRIEQNIYPDRHGIDTWDPTNVGRVRVHIVNSLMYREITGLEPPETPVSAREYEQYGLPWFELYDEAKATWPRRRSSRA